MNLLLVLVIIIVCSLFIRRNDYFQSGGDAVAVPAPAKIGGSVFSISNSNFPGLPPGFLQVSINGDLMELNSLVVVDGKLVSRMDMVINRKTRTNTVYISEDGTAGTRQPIRLNLLKSAADFKYTFEGVFQLLITQWVIPSNEFKQLLTSHGIQDPSSFVTPVVNPTTPVPIIPVVSRGGDAGAPAPPSPPASSLPANVVRLTKAGVNYDYKINMMGEDIDIQKSDGTGITASRSTFTYGYGKNGNYGAGNMRPVTAMTKGRIVSVENIPENFVYVWMFPKDPYVRNLLLKLGSPSLNAMINRIPANPNRYVVVMAAGKPVVMVVNGINGTIPDFSNSKELHDISLLHQPSTDSAQKEAILKAKTEYNCNTLSGAKQYLSDLFYVPDMGGCNYASYN